MEIHRPKAIHGWRELAKEVGIIVLGVLIALAAEQVAEALRDQHRAAEARTYIRAEIAQNLGMMTVRLRSDDCVKTRLNEIGGLLDARAAGRPPALPIWIGRPQTFVMHTTRFGAAESSGRASLLSQDEQAGIGRLYAEFATFNELVGRERPAWARLQVLEDAPPVNPTLEAELRLARQEAKYDRSRAAQAVKEATRDAKAIGIEPDTTSWRPNKGGGLVAACVGLHTPREQAIALAFGQGDRISEP